MKNSKLETLAKSVRKRIFKFKTKSGYGHLASCLSCVDIVSSLYYDDETLKEDYPTIRLKNIIGFVKNVDTASSHITDFRIP